MVLLIVFVILFYLITFIIINQKRSGKSVHLIDGMMTGNEHKIIEQNPSKQNSKTVNLSENQSQGLEFSWSFWLYVNDLRGNYQNIFVKGSEATCIHGYGESLGEVYNEKIYLIERNRQKILQRLYPKSCSYNSILGALFRKKQFPSLDSSKMLPALLGIFAGMRYGYKRQFSHKNHVYSPNLLSHKNNRLTYSQLWALFQKQNRL